MKKFFLSILFIVPLVLIGISKLKQPKENKFSSRKIDYILVEKEKRLLSLYERNVLLKQYKIALGSSPIGHKKKAGDGKTPEGTYQVIFKNPQSSYHLSLKISYPSKEDIANAKTINVNPGSDIMIHGIRNGLGWIGKYHTTLDWTRGCIAVSNDEIEQIYSMVKEGTVVKIIP